MTCKLEEKQNTEALGKPFPNETENTIRDTIYSVDTDHTLNLKERIADVHGIDSKVTKAANELDRYVSDPQTRKSP